MKIAHDLSNLILNILEKRKEIYQSEITEILNIRNQRTSEAVKILLNEHKITRTRVRYKKGMTFLITLNGAHKGLPKFNLSALLHNNQFSPCVGCSIDCDPPTCVKLIKWIE